MKPLPFVSKKSYRKTRQLLENWVHRSELLAHGKRPGISKSDRERLAVIVSMFVEARRDPNIHLPPVAEHYAQARKFANAWLDLLSSHEPTKAAKEEFVQIMAELFANVDKDKLLQIFLSSVPMEEDKK